MRVRSCFFPAIVLRTTARIASAGLALTFISACATDKSGPTELSSRVSADRGGTPAAVEGLVSTVWQQTARDLVAGASYNPLQAAHAYPLVGVAQYQAVQQAEAAINGQGRVRLESDRGAVAGASVVVLSSLFPTKAQMLEDLVATQANAGPGDTHPAFIAGEAIGRAVGTAMVTRAQSDGFSVVANPAPPVGPGFWTTNAPGLPVAGGQFAGIARWFLTSANQFRPGPPPAFGSDAFNAALAEIRQISDTLTTEQSRIAAFWALNPGTPTASGFWLDYASQRIVEHGLSERDATHVFALLSATMEDATVGCWDAKLTYWLVRPWKADTGIIPLASVGKPNHPSYPSGHSCVSSSAGAVIASFFPERATELNAMVVEAGLSRMYGGIHYRFDCETGQALGRNVAAFAIAADQHGQSELTVR
jgi:PAP2 superfamily